jgi:glycosyltransferase involved in cell wall biosynthesis
MATAEREHRTGGVSLIAHLPYYWHAARALHDAGLLQVFVGPPMATRPAGGGRIPVVGGLIEYFNRTRIEPGLEGVNVARMWEAQVVALAAQRAAMATGHGTALRARVAMWDLAATARMGRPAALHAVSGMGTLSGRRARRDGAVVVADARAAHPHELGPSVAGALARRDVDYRLPDSSITGLLVREFERADYIVCNSQYTRGTFLTRGFDPGRVIAVSLGCDPDRFRPAPSPPEQFTVLFAGRDPLGKGILDVADAARALPTDSRLIITGQPDSRTSEALARLRCRVEVIGAVPADGMEALYRSSSLLLLPSLSDGFGMVVLEAMACGLPVIVSDRVGAASLVSQGVEGYVVPAGAPDALAERLGHLAVDPDGRASMGEAARRVAERNTWDDYGRRLVEAYRGHILPLAH